MISRVVVPTVPGQRGPVAVVRPDRQPGELSPAVGPAEAGPELDTHDTAEEAHQDRGAVVRHSQFVIFQLAEVAVPRKPFAAILTRIGRLACDTW